MIECGLADDLGSAEHMRRFAARALQDRVPISCSFDVTYRCNLRCVHCYGGHLVAQGPAQAGELGTDETLRLLREVADAGCLDLLVSGGEPLLRDDFADIYVAACRLGMLLTVFTNGTLVDDQVLSVLSEYPPRRVEISVYGASEATYEQITRVPGSFARAMRGIHSLSEAGVPLGLKTMILKDNVDEVSAIEALADDLGVRFRMDPLVTPRLDGDPRPLEQRVDPEVAAAVELGSEQRVRDAAGFRERQEAAPDDSALYDCGAGLMGFHLDPRGGMHPCLMSQYIAVDTNGGGIAAAWPRLVETMEGLRRKEDSACVGCNLKAVCGYCPGLFALETGSAYEHADYLCGLGARRSGIIQRDAR
jgi:radical SAM protein with 4Fe4S-binding SPASM domain